MGAVFVGIATAAAYAQSPRTPMRVYQVDIDRTSLSVALIQLAQQTGIQIARYSDNTPAPAAVGPVHARVGVDQALDLLLSGTGLGYRFINERLISVFAIAPPSQQEQAAISTPVSPPPATPDVATRPGFFARFAALLGVHPARGHVEECRVDDFAADTAFSSLNEVVVTGSRVLANSDGSPTHVTVVTAEELLDIQPAGMIQGLNNLPAFLGSINPASNTNTGGYNTLNLRGIGSLRALVLVDGHRVGPTRGAGTVDVDVIPQMLLQRVEIVTGGASAVYGSDAVSGVVNFLTDTKFNGFKANLQSGESTYGDDYKNSIGVAFGTSLFDGRGHFEGSLEYRDYPGLRDRQSRSFLDPIWTEQGSVVNGGTVGTTSNPYRLTSGAMLSTASFGGLVNTGPLSGLQFAQIGTLSAFNAGTPTGTAGVAVGGDGAYYVRSSLVSGQQIGQSFGRFDYDFAPSLHGYVQATLSRFRQNYTQQNVLLNRTLIGYNNAFLSTVQSQYQAVIAAQRAADPLGSFAFSKLDTGIPNNSLEATERYDMLAAGLSGAIGRYSWDLGYVRTDSTEKLQNQQNVNVARLYAALNSVVNPANGQIACNAALVNPAAYGDCVPLNPFGPQSESLRAVNYISQVTSSRQRYVADDALFTLKGTPFSLPAGAVNMALTGEYRRLRYDVVSDARPTDPLNCAGIQFNCNATMSPYNGNVVAALDPVAQTVREVALETDLPIVVNRLFVKALNVEAALRSTYYDTSGSVATGKIGANWSLNEQFLVRATRSRDIRAPNLTELRAPPAYTLKNYVDLHTGASGLVSSVSEGNPDLKPEKADTTTGGVVWKPRSIPGFSLAIDGYRIRIKEAIVSIDGFQPPSQQTCEASGGTSPVCSLYVRPFSFDNTSAANFPTRLKAVSLNLAALDTYGMDLEANYAVRLHGHKLQLRALFNWQPHLIYDNGPNGSVDVGGAADGIGGLPPIPATKLALTAAYEASPGIVVRVQERWRGPYRQNGASALVFADPSLPSVAYTDVNFNFRANRSLSWFLNVQNLWNTKPDPWASSGGSVQPNYLGGYAQGDDIEGRFYTLGVRLRM